MTNSITVKGKSEEIAFNAIIPLLELTTFISESAILADEERDNENATSPGGFPTALFTALLPAKARAAVGWNLAEEGWNADKAKAAFAFRLERKSRKLTDAEKQERTAKALATKQETWDAKNAALAAAGTPADVITLAIGTRPV